MRPHAPAVIAEEHGEAARLDSESGTDSAAPGLVARRSGTTGTP